MSWEKFFWGRYGGEAYRTFNRLRLPFNFVQVMRDFMSLILFAHIAASYLILGGYNLLYFTFWGLHMTYISLQLNSAAAQDQKDHPAVVQGPLRLRWRMAVIVFQITLVTEIIVTLFFFGLLWETPEEMTTIHLFAISIHVTPLVFLLFDFFVQKWVFRPSHIWFTVATVAIYLVLNFIFVMATGLLIYPVLKWNDLVSVVIVVYSFLIPAVIHELLMMISKINLKKLSEIPLTHTNKLNLTG
ncbi:unnamed protein product [Moneuplotes crassus]|uniref:Uncharacterized protein n=1 Tax=Euplotes crassus TaxID=5936 RepID=A0AAD1XWP8_EUPCR|nr:unnamed protein product [Moneuplotes crassus]